MGKRAFINNSHVEGYLYEYELEERVTGENSKVSGTNYIRGRVDIATDEELVNIVSVYYTYVTGMTSKGQSNPTYGYLKDMITKTSCSMITQEYVAGDKPGEGYCNDDFDF